MKAFCLFVLLLAMPGTAPGYDWSLGEDVNLNLRGDITYALKLRTEYPTPRFVTPGNPYYVSGDANIDKWDLGNNAFIGTVEVILDSTHVSAFGRVKGHYDFVYDDPGKYSEEVREHAAYNITDALEYYLEGRYGGFTGRLGRQIVQWGESTAPVYAPGVNIVSPFFTQKVSSAGYTFRDWQVPSLLTWASYEITDSLSVEGVWNPDFDPRYYFPVVSTFQSPTDLLGFGADSPLVDDQRPKDFEDQQQYGGAIRWVLPSLSQLELGLYYYHYLARFPVMTMPEAWPAKVVVEYPEADMIGMSFSQAIQEWGLNLQLGGELAYRPNDPLQKDGPNSPFLEQITGLETTVGGWEEANTLTWVLNGMRFFFDVLDFTPWTFTMTPLFEVYGKINLDYDDEELFSDPKYTAYYTVQFPLATSDMIDNTKLSLNFSSMGGLSSELNKLHHLIFSATAKYGDTWEVLLGYDLAVGNLDQDPQGLWMWDRDAFTFKLTYYFI